MSHILDQIRTTIGSEMAFMFRDAVLTRYTQGVGSDPNDPPAPVATTFTCKALRDNWSKGHIANGLVAAEDAKIVVLQTTLGTEPKVGDHIRIGTGPIFIVSDGGGSMSAISADPADATWELRGRTA